MSTPERIAGERHARMTLAALTEPGDPTTGTLIATIGAEATLQALTGAKVSLPSQVDPDAVELWRRRLAPDTDQAVLDQLAAVTEQHGLHVLIPGDPGWPAGLADLGAAAPPALWAKGDPELLASPPASRLTMTGSRACTSYGSTIAADLAMSLAADSRVIVSGGAFGIDAAVHLATLAVHPGATIAVLASGLDRVYPAGNREFLTRVAEHGMLLSELPPGTPPSMQRFRSRSRLLAALGGATVIVEAGARSGALDVADRAFDLGRPVGAVPGPVTSAASTGCHRLLRAGIAELVTHAGDVTELLDRGHAGRVLGDRQMLAGPRLPAGRDTEALTGDDPLESGFPARSL